MFPASSLSVDSDDEITFTVNYFVTEFYLRSALFEYISPSRTKAGGCHLCIDMRSIT